MPYKDIATKRLRDKERRRANPASSRESVKKWQDANPDKAKAKSLRNQKKPRYKLSKALRDAKDRCINPKNKQYKYYGAKGVQYLLDQEQAITKLLPEYTRMLELGIRPSLDRIDGAGHYSIDNVQILEFVENSLKPHL